MNNENKKKTCHRENSCFYTASFRLSLDLEIDNKLKLIYYILYKELENIKINNIIINGTVDFKISKFFYNNVS